MGKKRIIPCLDIKDGRVVKGINFLGLREIGDPVEYAIQYSKQGADEIVLLNIDSSKSGRADMLELVKEISDIVPAPLIIGGGVQELDYIRKLLEAGAKKVSINSAVVKRPGFLKEASDNFGRGRIVLAVDGKNIGRNNYRVMIDGGKTDSGIDLISWACKGESMGAGEILLTSMDADGVKCGYDIAMLNAVINAVNIPVIASGGCGTIGHFIKVFKEAGCDAALAASIFHYGDLTVDKVKEVLAQNGIAVEFNKEGECA